MTTARPELDHSRVRIVPCSDQAIFNSFSCGERTIDRWVRNCCALQERSRVRLFGAMQDGDPLVRGFYSLSIIGEKSKSLLAEVVEHHNQSGFVPFIYIDYVAVDAPFQNKGLGKVLISNALERCAFVAQSIGVWGAALHSLNDRTTALYHRYGFRQKTKSPEHKFMAMPSQALFDVASEIQEQRSKVKRAAESP